MKRIFFALMLTFSAFSLVKAQVGVNTENPDPSAILDIKDNTKGILIPRLTSAQKLDIKSPATSLLVYDTDLSCYSQYDGTRWKCLDQRNEAKWFYMPSIAINTEAITDVSTNPNATEPPLNLFTEYQKQFSATDNTTFYKNPGAPATISYFSSPDELNYYITYYSKDVFEIINLSDTGVLTYRIIGNATDETHINVVFVIKDK